MDYLEIGCTPADEGCAQVGQDNYMARSRAECIAFINQLRRIHGKEPAGASLRVRSNPHEFGEYLEVACYYTAIYPESEETQRAIEYAFQCEGGVPEYWDSQAIAELTSKGFPPAERERTVETSVEDPERFDGQS